LVAAGIYHVSRERNGSEDPNLNPELGLVIGESPIKGLAGVQSYREQVDLFRRNCREVEALRHRGEVNRLRTIRGKEGEARKLESGAG